MGTAERKEREKQQRKLDIINAAEKVFFEKGFENSTMDDVASEVELSKGTLYLYFKSKEELFYEISNRGENLLKNYFRKAVEKKQGNGLDRVRAIGEAFIKFFKEHHEYHEAMLYDHSNNEDKININHITTKEAMSKKDNIFINTIIEGIEDGSIRSDVDPVIASFLLWGHTMGVLQLIASKGSKIEKMTGIKSDELLDHSLDFEFEALRSR